MIVAKITLSIAAILFAIGFGGSLINFAMDGFKTYLVLGREVLMLRWIICIGACFFLISGLIYAICKLWE